jgi:hypothetical protein
MRAYVSVLTVVAAICGLAASNPAEASAHSGAYSLQLIDENGRELPTFQQDGRTFVLGSLGRRYSLKVSNHSSHRVEFVSSVDGRDVLDGKTSSWNKDGYVVEPYGEVVIDGFRLSHETVAAFRFSSVDHSYASKMGDARDVGVIGVAVFPEREEQSVVQGAPQPHFWNNLWNRAGGDDEAQSAPAGGGRGGAGSLADLAPAPPPASGAAPMSPPAPDEKAAAPVDGALATGHAEAKRKEARRGLGTEFGEQRDSHVNEVQFVRASSQPAHVLSLRYDDRAGLLALGIDLDPARTARLQELRLRATAEPFRESGFSEPPAGWPAGSNGR